MLDNKTYRLLKEIYKKKRLTIEEIKNKLKTTDDLSQNEHILSLRENKFIERWESGPINTQYEREFLGYKITLAGSAYVEHRIRERRNFWVPYLITTAIALLSLITSLTDH